MERPKFLKGLRQGLESIGEGFASMNIVPRSPEQRVLSDEEAMRADTEALRGDWEAVNMNAPHIGEQGKTLEGEK